MENYHFLPETDSTNVWMWNRLRETALPEGFVLQTGHQTAGKGQKGNSWEAEAGKNLLFSMLFYPNHLPFEELFYLSQVVSLGIKRVLDEVAEGFSVKWPNDIYWHDRKLAGILIENSLQGNRVKTVVGIGLNVNQEIFLSNAPNPVSLAQLSGKHYDLASLLEALTASIMDLYLETDRDSLRAAYAHSLYRREGYHPYSTDTEHFEARIADIHPDGQLILETRSGQQKGFYFKEVKYENPNPEGKKKNT